MYNVIIVDDEPVIRFGLKASINWKQEGLNLLGDFPNGKEALKKIEKNNVDILITDIKMPVMDGLSLMKKALELFPKIKVILVSSHSDFEYVHEGLKYGAIDYVLKHTLEPEEFLQVIKKCVNRIKEEKVTEEKIKLVDQTVLLQERKKIEHQLKSFLLLGKDSNSEKELKQRISGSHFIIYMKMVNVERIEEDLGFLYKSLIIEEIQGYFYINLESGICFPVRDKDLVFLVEDKVDPELFIQNLREGILNQTEVNFSFGYQLFSDLTGIEKALNQCIKASERYFFHPNRYIFSYKEPESDSRYNPLKAKDLKQFLFPYDESKVTELVKARAMLWEGEIITPEEIKNESSLLLTNLFIKLIDFSILQVKVMQIKQSDTLDELIHVLLFQIKDCIQLVSDQHTTLHVDNEILENALKYIHKHFTKELTLQMVADHIHISRNYFSILFKKHTNQKFIDYVIDLRIKMASELLKNTKLKVYEVAEKSGFNDVKYFSKLFKKITGYSPVDYRTINKI